MIPCKVLQNIRDFSELADYVVQNGVLLCKSY